MKTFTPPAYTRGLRQRGAVVIMFGLTVVVLIGFIGLAVDLGRFFVIKTELQNAMDACALSAASQLRPGSNNAADLMRAVAYGRVFTTGGTAGNDLIRNKANFQSTTVNLANSDVTFADSINGPYATSSTVNANARFAKCEYPLSGLPIYFMPVLNPNLTSQTVSAMAVATVGRETCNVVPAAICQRLSSTATPPFGLNPGEWLSLGSSTTSPAPGQYGWVDYSAAAGGTSEVKDGLTNLGQCQLPAIGDRTPESGRKTAAEVAWNTRFGIYTSPYSINDITSFPPDKTGFSYFGQNVGADSNPQRLVANWPKTSDAETVPRAYDQNNISAPPSTPNFLAAAAALRPYEQLTTIFNGPTTFATGGVGGQYNDPGRSNRRLLVVPILDCSTSTITAHGCALMLNPFGKVSGLGGADINGKLEYLGLVGATNSPCGSGNTTEPNISVLVK